MQPGDLGLTCNLPLNNGLLCQITDIISAHTIMMTDEGKKIYPGRIYEIWIFGDDYWLVRPEWVKPLPPEDEIETVQGEEIEA